MVSMKREVTRCLRLVVIMFLGEVTRHLRLVFIMFLGEVTEVKLSQGMGGVESNSSPGR